MNPSASMRPKYNSRQVFSAELEIELIKYLEQYSKMNYSLGYLECRKLAFEIAMKKNIQVPDNWTQNKMAGIDWLKYFLHRNPKVNLKKLERSLSQTTSFYRHNNVDLFFDKLENLLITYPCFSDGSRIYYFDRIGCTRVKSPGKLITPNKMRQFNQITCSEKSDLINVCCILNAHGHIIPPVIFCPLDKYKTHMINGAPSGTLCLTCQSRYMNSELLMETLKHFIKFTNSSKKLPSLFIMDNYDRQIISLSVFDYAKDNGVTILALPPFYSNHLRPLGLSIYGLFETYFNAAVDSWTHENTGKTFDTFSLSPCLKSAFDKSMIPENILAGFKVTGIYPFNRHAITNEDVSVKAVTDQQLRISLAETHKSQQVYDSIRYSNKINQIGDCFNVSQKSIFNPEIVPVESIIENNKDNTDLCSKFNSDIADNELFNTDLTGFEQLNREPEEGGYVLIELSSKKSKKLNKNIFCYGKILKSIDQDQILEISYLRNYENLKTKIILPVISDLSSVHLNNVKAIYLTM